MKVWRFFSSSVLPLCLAFCVVFSAVVLDCVDVKAATTKTYPNADFLFVRVVQVSLMQVKLLLAVLVRIPAPLIRAV